MRDALELIVHGAGPSLADLAALIQIPPWHADAACKEHPEVHFFLAHGETAEAPRAICAGCLVRDECLAYAMAHEDDLDGVWAGTSPKERRAMRRAAA